MLDKLDLMLFLSETANAYCDLVMRSLALSRTARERNDFDRSAKALALANYFNGQQAAISDLMLSLNEGGK